MKFWVELMLVPLRIMVATAFFMLLIMGFLFAMWGIAWFMGIARPLF